MSPIFSLVPSNKTAAGATGAILASIRDNDQTEGDLSSIAPSSAPSTANEAEGENRATHVFASLLFDLPPSLDQQSIASTSMVSASQVPQLSPDGEATGIKARNPFDGDVSTSNASASTGDAFAPTPVPSPQNTPSRNTGAPTLGASGESVGSQSAGGNENVAVAGYTGIAMAAAGATAAVAAADRDGSIDRTASYDGSFISEKPSEVDDSIDHASHVITGRQETVQNDALLRIDAALSTADWATVLAVANEVTAETISLPSDISSVQAPSVAASRDRSKLSKEDAMKAAQIEELMTKGAWSEVGETAAKYEEESIQSKTKAANAVDTSDDVSHRSNKSQRSFIDVILGRNLPSDENADSSAAPVSSAAAAAGTGLAAAGMAAASAALSSRDDSSEGFALAPTQSTDASPSIAASPDSGLGLPNAYIDKQSETLDWATLDALNTLNGNQTSEKSSSLYSADDIGLLAKKSKMKSSAKKLSPRKLAVGFGSSKKSKPSSSDDDDTSPKSSKWKSKLPFGVGKSSKKTSAIASVALLEDSSVESRSIGSEHITGQEEAVSSPSETQAADQVSNISDTSNAVPGALGQAFAHAALPPSDNVSDIYASSTSASITKDDSKSATSLRDSLDRAIEEGNWAAVEAAAADMLEQSSSDGSDLIGGGATSVGSTEFHSGRSRLSSRSSSIGSGSVTDSKVQAIEAAIMSNDWKKVSELSSAYKAEGVNDSPVDMEKMKEAYSPVARASAEAERWEAVAQENQPKNSEATEAATDAAQWAIDRSFADSSGRDEV